MGFGQCLHAAQIVLEGVQIQDKRWGVHLFEAIPHPCGRRQCYRGSLAKRSMLSFGSHENSAIRQFAQPPETA